MSDSRNDIQRLFGHFGLDPSEYVESSQLSTANPEVADEQAKSGEAADHRGIGSSIASLFSRN
tara:strand:+ start:1796 stop:1984 length:189 start_codon:yes stop_codon:yes gene_type:complete